MEPAGSQGSPGVRGDRSPSSLELSRRSRITPTVSSSRYKRCQCCPYGYHIDVDFMDFMESARAEAKLKSLHRLHKNKRSMRENMESAVLLQDPTAIKQDTTVMCLDPQDTNQSIDDLEFFNRYVMDDINQSINGAMEYIDNLFSARSTDRLGRGLSSSTQNQSEINNTYREGDLLDAASFPKFNLERSRSVISTPVPIRRGISSPLLLTRGNTDSLTRSFDRRNRGVNIHPVETFDNVTSNDFDMNSNLPGNGNSDSGRLSANEKPNRDSILNDDVSDKFMENTKTVSENGQNNNSSEYSSVNLDGPDMKCSTPVVKNNKLVMDTNTNNNNSGKIEKTIAENGKQKTVNKTNENQSLTIGLSSPYDSEDSNSSRDEKVELNLSSDCLDDSVISQERIHQNENTVQKQSKVETADKVGDEKKIESQAQNEIKIQTESKLQNENIAENDSVKIVENSLSKNSIENLESVEPDRTVVAILSNKEMNQLTPSEPNTATNSASSAKLARAIAAILPRNLGRGNGGCSSVTFDTATLSLLRHHIAASLEEMRRLESLVKAVPILQVRISVLREEKRLLKLELMKERIDNKQNGVHKVSSATDDLNSENELICSISRRISDSEFNPNHYNLSTTEQIQSEISGENASYKSTCAYDENKKSNDVILCAKCKLNLLKTDRDCNSLSDSQSETNLQENLLNKSPMNNKRSTSRKLSSLPDISSRKSVFKKLQRHQDSDHKDAAIQCFISDNDSNSRQYGDLLGSFPKPKQLKKVTLSKLESASWLMKMPSNEGHSECHEDLKNESALEDGLSSLMDTRLKPLSNKNISEIQRDESFSEASKMKLDFDRMSEQPPDLVLAHGALDYKTLHGHDETSSFSSFRNNAEDNTSKLQGQLKGFDSDRFLEKLTKSAVKSQQNIGCDVGTMTENFEEMNIKSDRKVLVDKYVNTDEIKADFETISSSTNTDSVILVSSYCSRDVIPKMNQFTETDVCCSGIERDTKAFVDKLINTDEIKTITTTTNTESVALASSSCLTDPIQKTNQSTETDVCCSGVDSNSKLMVDQFVNTDETKVETSSTNTESVVLVDSSCLTESSPILNKIIDTETHYSDNGNSVNNREIIITCDTYMPYMQTDTSESGKNLYENKSAGSAAVEALFKKQIDTADTSVQTEKYSDSVKSECCDVMCEAEIKTQTTDVMCEAQIRPQSSDVMCDAEIKPETTDVMCEASIKPRSSSVSCEAAIKPQASDANCMASIKVQSKDISCEIKPCQCDVQISANILPHMKETGCTANIQPKTNDFCCEARPETHDKFCSTESLCKSEVDETCKTHCDKSMQISKKSVENSSHKSLTNTENSARNTADKYSEHIHSDISTRNDASGQKFNSTNISTETKPIEFGLLNRKSVFEAKPQDNLPAVKQQSGVTSIFPESCMISRLRLYKSEPMLASRPTSDVLLGQSEARKWRSQFFVIPNIETVARDSDTDDSSRRFLFSLKLVSACRTCNTWLNDSVQVNRKQLNSASDAIKEAWFRLANQKDVQTEELTEFLNQLFSNSSNLIKFVINMTDVNGNTALHYAVSYGNCVVIGQLLDTGCCDVSIQNRAGCTALMLAVLVPMTTEEQRLVFQRLTRLGGLEARIETTGQTALMLAASRNHGDSVRLLLDAGCDVNACDSEGSTALMCASEHGHSDVVKILLAHPLCDSSISDMDGSTALSVAMEAGHRHIGVLIYTHLNFRKSAMDSRSIRRSLRRSKKE